MPAQRCGYENCAWNSYTKAQMDKGFLNFTPCNYCDDVLYHSEFCKSEDWKRFHKQNCKHTKKQIKNTNGERGNLENYQIQQKNDECLGKGAYGYVTKVKDKKTGKVYAMKIISNIF